MHSKIPRTDETRHGFDSKTGLSRRTMLALLGVGTGIGAMSGIARAHPETETTDDPEEPHDHDDLRGPAGDLSQPLVDHDAATAGIVSSGPSTKVVKNLAVTGRTDRSALPGGTTDVWAHDGYAYLGTFNTPCGTGQNYNPDVGPVDLVDGIEEPGIVVVDVHNRNKPVYVGNLPSVAGSRTNDVKVADMNSGTVLAHSNEACGGGPGGFELYNVDDPESPVHLAHVQTDDINPVLRDLGFVDFGVHNVWLFTQGKRDYLAAVVESELGNFQLFDITDPTSPTLVSAWGAESLLLPSVDWFTTTDFGLILEADEFLFDGFGSSQNRFLHDITVSEDGTKAYLANWDAGLVLLDVSNPTAPEFVSQAIDPTAGDGEVNSHQAWPTADGTVVVETEEDFDPFSLTFEVTSGANTGEYAVAEASFTEPIVDLPNGTLSGPTVYVGLACNGDIPVPPAPSSDHIALVQRGACRFDEKASNVLAAGYSGMVVFNNEANGDVLVVMSGDPRPISGVFVAHSTGLAIAGVADDSGLVVGASGAEVEVVSSYGRWGGIRLWDYTDEANPVLASEFDTVCSANPGDPSCDPRGTYSVHNVVVEDDTVYVSWYSDGVLILDISDPYNPVEVARYTESGLEFEAANGGIQDVWGIDKEPNQPWLYASDRNGGLYVLKEFGSGSAKNDKNGK